MQELGRGSGGLFLTADVPQAHPSGSGGIFHCVLAIAHCGGNAVRQGRPLSWRLPAKRFLSEIPAGPCSWDLSECPSDLRVSLSCCAFLRQELPHRSRTPSCRLFAEVYEPPPASRPAIIGSSIQLWDRSAVMEFSKRHGSRSRTSAFSSASAARASLGLRSCQPARQERELLPNPGWCSYLELQWRNSSQAWGLGLDGFDASAARDRQNRPPKPRKGERMKTSPDGGLTVCSPRALFFDFGVFREWLPRTFCSPPDRIRGRKSCLYSSTAASDQKLVRLGLAAPGR